jgi:hypothetical protein
MADARDLARAWLRSVGEEELAAVLDAFDLRARYDHLERPLELSVAVFAELAEILESKQPLEAAVHSGGGRQNG